MKKQNHKPGHLVLLVALLASSCLTGAVQLVDPTRPPDALIPNSQKLAIEGPLKLTATFIYPDRRIAIISDQVVMVGNQVDTYTIINIQRDTVELKGSDETPVTLTLLPAVKTARAANKG